eukprot:131138-Pyramimonas_sp.AAC.1
MLWPASCPGAGSGPRRPPRLPGGERDLAGSPLFKYRLMRRSAATPEDQPPPLSCHPACSHLRRLDATLEDQRSETPTIK